MPSNSAKAVIDPEDWVLVGKSLEKENATMSVHNTDMSTLGEPDPTQTESHEESLEDLIRVALLYGADYEINDESDPLPFDILDPNEVEDTDDSPFDFSPYGPFLDDEDTMVSNSIDEKLANKSLLITGKGNSLNQASPIQKEFDIKKPSVLELLEGPGENPSFDSSYDFSVSRFELPPLQESPLLQESLVRHDAFSFLSETETMVPISENCGTGLTSSLSGTSLLTLAQLEHTMPLDAHQDLEVRYYAPFIGLNSALPFINVTKGSHSAIWSLKAFVKKLESFTTLNALAVKEDSITIWTKFTELVSPVMDPVIDITKQYVAPALSQAGVWTGIRIKSLLLKTCSFTGNVAEYLFFKACNWTWKGISFLYRFSKSDQYWRIVELSVVGAASFLKWLVNGASKLVEIFVQAGVASYEFYLHDTDRNTKADLNEQSHSTTPNAEASFNLNIWDRACGGLTWVKDKYTYLHSDESWKDMDQSVRAGVQWTKSKYLELCTWLETKLEQSDGKLKTT